ncbi:tetratricopeptide repeat protein [Myroides sp. LJL116]
MKKTACYTLDRDVLFEYITSEDFQTYKGMLSQEATQEASQALKVIQLKPTSTIDDLIESFDRLSNNQKAAKQLEIEKNTSLPLKERLNSVEKEANIPLETQLLETNEKINKAEKQKKQGLIDKFIETNPKIVPTKKPSLTSINIEDSLVDNNSIMTETLAKIYLDQKKYQKAIQAYEILILKYPEKSSFFADQISDIKVLQQHNN